MLAPIFADRYAVGFQSRVYRNVARQALIAQGSQKSDDVLDLLGRKDWFAPPSAIDLGQSLDAVEGRHNRRLVQHSVNAGAITTRQLRARPINPTGSPPAGLRKLHREPATAQVAPELLAEQRITDAAGASLILILSDINMPGMSGLELLPKAKALRPDVLIIMITAYGDAETKRKALENGAEALLTKPIDFGTLRSEIDTRIERTA